MANPNLENGYLKLANELVEAICKTNLSPNESQVLWFVIRMTYGYNKKMARISKKKWEEGTGLKATNVYRVLRHLIKRNMVIRGDHSRSNSVGLQKNYKKWKRVIRGDQSDQYRSPMVIRGDHPLPIINKKQLIKTRENHKEIQPKKCSYCETLFTPEKIWHKSCPQCFVNPPARSPIKGHKVSPCSLCGWQPGPGYEGMNNKNQCLDCQQPDKIIPISKRKEVIK